MFERGGELGPTRDFKARRVGQAVCKGAAGDQPEVVGPVEVKVDFSGCIVVVLILVVPPISEHGAGDRVEALGVTAECAKDLVVVDAPTDLRDRFRVSG